MPQQPDRFDLYTFIAGAALERGNPFPLECNCGGVVTIMPPFQDEYVVCPRCEARIKISSCGVSFSTNALASRGCSSTA